MAGCRFALCLGLEDVQQVSLRTQEGYCRRSLKEYLNHLNFALGSCGELHSCYESFKKADQITGDEYKSLDMLHYKVENGLLKLVESLQKKQKEGKWKDNLYAT